MYKIYICTYISSANKRMMRYNKLQYYRIVPQRQQQHIQISIYLGWYTCSITHTHTREHTTCTQNTAAILKRVPWIGFLLWHTNQPTDRNSNSDPAKEYDAIRLIVDVGLHDFLEFLRLSNFHTTRWCERRRWKIRTNAHVQKYGMPGIWCVGGAIQTRTGTVMIQIKRSLRCFWLTVSLSLSVFFTGLQNFRYNALHVLLFFTWRMC